MENSPLSRLPPELRNYIYELTLIERNDIKINKPRTCHNPSRVWKPPPLLQTCGQLRTEALPVYYSNNKFVVVENFWSEPVTLEAWLGTIGAEARRCVRSIRPFLLHTFATLELAKGQSRWCKGHLRTEDVAVPNAKLWFPYHWQDEDLSSCVKWTCAE